MTDVLAHWHAVAEAAVPFTCGHAGNTAPMSCPQCKLWAAINRAQESERETAPTVGRVGAVDGPDDSGTDSKVAHRPIVTLDPEKLAELRVAALTSIDSNGWGPDIYGADLLELLNAYDRACGALRDER